MKCSVSLVVRLEVENEYCILAISQRIRLSMFLEPNEIL